MMDLYSKNDNPFKGNFKTLESLVDRISEVFHCPVTIEDANHRLLAYSQHNEESDQARIQTIIGRRVPEKVINSLWKNHILAKINRTDEPVRIAQIKEVGLGDRIAIAIRKNNEVLGYIWALEVERKLSDQSFPLFKQAAQAVKNQLLQLQGQQKEADEGLMSFLEAFNRECALEKRNPRKICGISAFASRFFFCCCLSISRSDF